MMPPEPTTPEPLSPVGQLVARLAHEGRQRILDGVVDATGRHRAEGPRKQLTPAQERAHEGSR